MVKYSFRNHINTSIDEIHDIVNKHDNDDYNDDDVNSTGTNQMYQISLGNVRFHLMDLVSHPIHQDESCLFKANLVQLADTSN